MDKRFVAAILMAHASVGQAGPDLIDTAQVISATPIIERVMESRQECDPAPAATPTAGMLGSNVREISRPAPAAPATAPAPTPAPAPAGNTGGYQYRY